MKDRIERAIAEREKLFALRDGDKEVWAQMDIHEKVLEDEWASITAHYSALFGKSAQQLGTQVGPGWWAHLIQLFESLMALPNFAGNFQIVQIKEKFGGLRCYFRLSNNDYENITPELRKCQEEALMLVQRAEVLCDSSCEICGQPGESRSGGWIKTVCDRHA